MTVFFSRKKARWLLIALALSMGFWGCAHAPETQVEKKAPPIFDAETLIPADPAAVVGTLDNGLTYYIRANTQPENRVELRLVVNSGSLQEEDDQLGLAHFVEHLAFNGIRNFAKQEIVDFLESTGMRFGPELNAYTSFGETVYQLQLPTDDLDRLETGIRILTDWAHLILFEEEEVERERPIIVEEWRLGRGADARMRDLQFPILFQDSRYAQRRPIGDVKVIEKASAEDLRRYYRDWYRPDLMAVVAVGDFDKDWLEQKIQSHFSVIPVREDAPPRVEYPVPDHKETLYAPATDPEAQNTRIGLYIKHDVTPFRTVGDYRRALLDYLYNGMLNDRLEEISKQADPPFIRAGSYNQRSVRSKEMYVLAARVQQDKIAAGLESLVTETQRVESFGFTATELERQKQRLLNWIDETYSDRDNMESENFVRAFVDHFLKGDPYNDISFDYRMFNDLLPGITLEEVNQRAGYWLTPENRVILVNAPEKAEIPSREGITALFRKVAAKELLAYEDQVSDEPLITGTLDGGKVVSRSEKPELGLIEWQLHNGVRVVLKPTDFKQEEILFSALSPGGNSLIPNKDYVAAVTAAAVAAESGVGNFNSTELEKKLTGKSVSVRPWIGGLFEGLEGSAAPDDLETLFQLIYLYVTAPRFDQQAFLAYQGQLQASVQNRLASPEAIFWDTVESIVSQNHFRTRPWTVELLSEMDLQISSRIYRERFEDIGDFTFFFVGNFDPDILEPLVTYYLGSLPAAGRQESWRDVGIKPPKGVINQEVVKGVEPKSLVQFVFTAPFSWSLASRLQILALAEVLDIDLRELVREEAGGTYGVWVDARGTHYPYEEARVTITFGCAPDKVAPLSELVVGEVKRLAAEGPSEEMVGKVKEIFKRERETQLQENAFWLQRLQFYAIHGLDPVNLLDYDQRVEGLTVESLRRTAADSLNPDNYVRVYLLPETKGD